MLKRKHFIISFALAVGVLGSCNRYVSPPFTSVDKISMILPGMTIDRVNSTLGIEPYNMLHMNSDGAIILSYNYRLKDKYLKVYTTNRDEFQRLTRNEDSQTKGSLWYNKEYQTLFVVFQNNQVQSMITTAGKQDSEFLLIAGNNIKLLSEEELDSFSEDGQDVMPIIYKIQQPTTKEKRFIFKRKESDNQ